MNNKIYNYNNDNYNLIWNRQKVIEPLPSTNWYFAFGSNMSRKRMQKRGLIWEHILKGKLNNYELSFNKRAYSIGEGFANIQKCEGATVEGVLYKLEDKNQAHILDDFEGTPIHYERQEIFVSCKEFKKPVKAFTYIANPKQVESDLSPSEDYLGHLLDGKRYLSNKYHYWLSQTKTGFEFDNYHDLPVFVYGTLKTGFGNHNRFCKNAYMIQDAVLDGTLYNMGLPYVTIPKTNIYCIGSMNYEHDSKQVSKLACELEFRDFTVNPLNGVKGQLICFEDWNELYNLDSLEGFTGKDSLNHYTRVLTTCWIDGIEEPCFVYVELNGKYFLESDVVKNGNYSNFRDDCLIDESADLDEPADLVDLFENADRFQI